MRRAERADGARVVLVDPAGGARLGRALEARGTDVRVRTSFSPDDPPLEGWDTLVVGCSEDGGGELIREVASSGRPAGAVILALVSEPDPALAARLMAWGADDLLPPPHSASSVLFRREVARTRADGARRPGRAHRIPLGDLELHTDTREVLRDDRTARLSRREFELLRRLGAAGGSVVNRERLIADVWGGSEGGASALDATIHRLRRRLDAGGIDGMVVETVRSVGYRIAPGVVDGSGGAS